MNYYLTLCLVYLVRLQWTFKILISHKIHYFHILMKQSNTSHSKTKDFTYHIYAIIFPLNDLHNNSKLVQGLF